MSDILALWWNYSPCNLGSTNNIHVNVTRGVMLTYVGITPLHKYDIIGRGFFFVYFFIRGADFFSPLSSGSSPLTHWLLSSYPLAPLLIPSGSSPLTLGLLSLPLRVLSPYPLAPPPLPSGSSPRTLGALDLLLPSGYSTLTLGVYRRCPK